MLKKLIGMTLAALLFAAPAMGETLTPDALLGFIKNVIDVASRPDPYFWIYERPENASVEDIPACAGTLRELGLEEVTPEIEANCYAWMREIQDVMAQNGMTFDVSRERLMLWLLYDAGYYEQPDAERPGVYAFDAEVYDVERMYRDFLAGVQRISNGELSFEGVDEDLSGVDWETGEGTRTVAFSLDKTAHAFTAKARQDWFDMEMLNFMSETIGVRESGRRLYFVLDGGQGCILFYQTPQWAAEFTAATGCPLFTGL